MAVAFDAVTTSDNAGSPASFSHTASGADRLVAALIKFEKDATAVSGTPTYGGANMTLLTRIDPSGAAANIGSIEIWYLIAPATGAQTLSVAWTATADDAFIAAMSFTGVDQTTPITGTVSAEKASGTNPTIDVSSGTDDLVVDFVGTDGGAQTFTPGASQTERFDTTTAKCGPTTSTTEPGAATVTMSETPSAGLKSLQVAFNVEAAAAGGSVVPRAMHQYRQRRAA